MIQYWKVIDGRLTTVEAPEQAEIVRLFAPDEAEVRAVAELTGAPTDLLMAACDRDERPRFESEEDMHLILVRVPFEEQPSPVAAVTVAFGVIATPSHLVSVCSVDAPVWSTLQKTRARLPSPSQRIPFLCALFMTIARLYLSHLQRIRVEADAAEQEIHSSMRNEMVIRMLHLEKCLVYFSTSLKGHDPLWGRLKRIQNREVSEEEQDLIEDVQIEFRQAHDLAEIHSNVLSGMMDAFASIISNNLNIVMKMLTSITIIVMLPTLIASIYGMNVDLPFQKSPHAFALTMGMSVLLSSAGVLIFLRKKFF